MRSTLSAELQGGGKCDEEEEIESELEVLSHAASVIAYLIAINTRPVRGRSTSKA